MDKRCHALSPSKLASSTPLPLSDTSTSSTPLSFSLMSAGWQTTVVPCTNYNTIQSEGTYHPAVYLCSTIRRHIMTLTNISCPCIDTVLNQFLDGSGQSQHHLTRADLVHWVPVYGLDSLSRLDTVRREKESTELHGCRLRVISRSLASYLKSLVMYATKQVRL